MVENNRFEIDDYKFIKELETHDKAKLRGHFYSDKAIGSSLIGVAFSKMLYSTYYRLWGIELASAIQIFKDVITFFAVSLICAFLAPLIYSFARKISQSAGFALLITTAICFGTPFYKYATLYYGHSLAGLFLFVAFFLWFNMQDETYINLGKVLVSGFFLGYAIITEYPTVVIAFLLGLYVLYILWKKQRLFDWRVYACLIVSAAIPILIAMAYNYTIFGNPFKTGYSFEMLSEFSEGQSIGLMGIGWPNLGNLFYMTFHTTMGIFWQSPVLLLAFIGWVRMARQSRYRAEAILSFGVVLVYSLVMSGYYIWWGGEAFTPRNLIPIFPFFAIPLVFLTQKAERVMLFIFAIISIVQMFIVATANGGGLALITQDMQNTSIATVFQHSIIYEIYLRNFLDQHFEINRGEQFFHLRGFPSLLPLLIIEACALAAFLKIVPKGGNQTR